ncbi:leucine-rich repeat-containing protein 47 [Hippoglossus hippoglossus]|uniref:leucine-rich repeat-containing protein 47 n=1 Tax=Hippoglossus hippoglossus TaxID=8267 RepID=UPI00148E7B21|nr:leucine-rich repeat-containing protein 47 [Hippoglossus hippoglossus]XP_035015132.1 leucine-rich repeat-containing protein 47 [Hippoglossus stenolepis]
MDDMETWPEIEKAATERRRELVLQGAGVDTRISSHGGLTSSIYSLTLLNYLEVSQCPSLTEIHEDIRRLTNLQSLILCRNKLASFPEVISLLGSLKVLDLSVNNLQVLPEGITQLSELNTLNVSCNSLEVLPDGLSRCTKLSTINVSKNRITRFPADLYSERLDLLSSLVASDNAIEELSGDVHKLSALKVLDLSGNKLKEIPSDLSDCPKLKEINFKGNKLNDKRLEKMVNGCQTKSILDYLRGKGKGRQGEDGGDAEGGRNADKKKRQQRKKKDKAADEPDEVEELNKMVVRVLHVSDAPTALTVKVMAEVKDVRPYLVCCVVRGMNLKAGNSLKRFLVAQTKLHDDLCGKRTTATIATHDVQLLKGPLTYDVKPPTQLKIVSLGRKEMTAVELMRHLHLEADELRKQKKRQNVTGLHKYLQLLQGKAFYPCLVDAEGLVISFPPITNSENTKIKKTTKELFLEVTSSTSLQTCKDIMDALIIKMAELNKFTAEHREEAGSDAEGEGPPEPLPSVEASSELIVQQVRTVDQDGNLKVVYPSKTDLSSNDISNLTIVW